MIGSWPTADGLLDALRRETGQAALEFDGDPAALTGGFWAELISFRLADPPAGWEGELVGRIMPSPEIAAKETAFQSEIARQGYPTPVVHAFGGPEDGVNGCAYLVMDLAAGAPLLSGLDGVTAALRMPSLARHLPVVLASALADLHGLDPTAVVHALDAAGVARPEQPEMLAGLGDRASALGRRDLARAAHSLQGAAGADEATVLCHGDLHPFNVLVDDTGTVTVLDWSAAMLAPAAYDLGFTSLVLAEPPLLVPPPLRPAIRGAGRWLSRRFLRFYEQATGGSIDPTTLEWQQALVCLRALVEVAEWVDAGTIDDRGGHPWVIAGEALAGRLGQLTAVPVASR
jgi:aminoglycoside phosphotransferase (APT) family kinase protein